MKRVLAVFLTLCMVLSGCGGTKNDGGSQVEFYYAVRSAETLGSAQTIGVERRMTHATSLMSVLELYFRGPSEERLISPFPAGTEVVSLLEQNGTPELVLSSQFFSLRAVELSIATGCLAKTICGYTGAQSVIISDETGGVHMELTPDSYYVEDAYQTDSGQNFTVYFPSEDRRYVIPEFREATLSENESTETYLIRELMAGPQTSGLQNAMPEGTELLNVTTSGGICSVDFSPEFYQSTDPDGYDIYTSVYAIVNTLTGLDSVDCVQFLKDGAAVKSCGVMLLGEPIARDTGVIGPAQTRSGELDVDFFMCQRITDDSFQVPVRVKQSISEPIDQAIVNKLLSYEPPKGFQNPVPYGTELLSISTSGNICYVDLSEKFIPPEDNQKTEQEAVWALVMTLTALDNINYVALTIEGESSGLAYVDITEPMTKGTVSLFGT